MNSEYQTWHALFKEGCQCCSPLLSSNMEDKSRILLGEYRTALQFYAAAFLSGTDSFVVQHLEST